MRVGEKQDVDYHFVDKDTFLAMKEKDLFVETTFYNGNYYGCSKAEVGDEKCIILDPNGVASFLALHDPHIITFYLEASEKTRRYRMAIRGDEEKAIEARIVNDREAFAKDRIPPVDFTVSCDEEGVDELSSKIHRLYLEKIK